MIGCPPWHIPCSGKVASWLTLVIIVMAPTARSPPYLERLEVKLITVCSWTVYLSDTDGVTSRAARDCRRPRPTARQGRRSPTVGGVGAGSHRQHEAVNPRAGVPWGTWGVTSRAGCAIAERLLATTLLFLCLCFVLS